MNEIYSQNSCGSSKNCGHAILLEKMLLEFYRRYTNKSVWIWREKATKYGRLYYRLVHSEHRMRDTGLPLLATPRASQDYKPIRKETQQERKGKHGRTLCADLGNRYPCYIGQHINPRFVEWMMGYPVDWTKVIKSE